MVQLPKVTVLEAEICLKMPDYHYKLYAFEEWGHYGMGNANCWKCIFDILLELNTFSLVGNLKRNTFPSFTMSNFSHYAIKEKDIF